MLIQVVHQGSVVFTDHITNYFGKREELSKRYLADELRFLEEHNGELKVVSREWPNTKWEDLTEEQQEEMSDYVGDNLIFRYERMRHAQNCMCTVHSGRIRVSVAAGGRVGDVFWFVPSWDMAMAAVRRLLQEAYIEGWLTITLASGGHIVETWKQFYKEYPQTYYEPADCDYYLNVFRHPRAEEIVPGYRAHDQDEIVSDEVEW